MLKIKFLNWLLNLSLSPIGMFFISSTLLSITMGVFAEFTIQHYYLAHLAYGFAFPMLLGYSYLVYFVIRQADRHFRKTKTLTEMEKVWSLEVGISLTILWDFWNEMFVDPGKPNGVSLLQYPYDFIGCLVGVILFLILYSIFFKKYFDKKYTLFNKL